MGETFDKAKGHAKEAVGDLTDNPDLEREGKIDRATGEVKEVVHKAKDKADEIADAAREKVREVVDKH
jgi:uncharacterized protein YjbJ (UPF0337 family)